MFLRLPRAWEVRTDRAGQLAAHRRRRYTLAYRCGCALAAPQACTPSASAALPALHAWTATSVRLPGKIRCLLSLFLFNAGVVPDSTRGDLLEEVANLVSGKAMC